MNIVFYFKVSVLHMKLEFCIVDFSCLTFYRHKLHNIHFRRFNQEIATEHSRNMTNL